MPRSFFVKMSEEVIMTEDILKKAVIVSIAKNSSEVVECERSLDELERLLDTAGAEALARVIQIKDSFDPRTCIGSGKVIEIKSIVENNNIDMVVFDFELSPMQIRNLENDIGDVIVIDRSMLILDIFALHAKSGEGKLQVELAQLKYTAPRLVGKGIELSRQGGGIGTRGPGETKLETDKRHLREKLSNLEARLAELEHNRAVMRAQRDRSGLTKIAVVGYTNAGKSTLLNKLTGADVLSEDKLFATLDPTTRKMLLPSGESVLITDTVGFIRKLPHHLVKAFKSTLDEVRYADILMIVSDMSDPELEEHLAVTEGIIEELGASDKPRIYVYNKCDRCDSAPARLEEKCSLIISAKNGGGIELLIESIEEIIKESKRDVKLLIPYSKQSIISEIYNEYSVKNVEYLDTVILVEATLDERGIGYFRKYISNE